MFKVVQVFIFALIPLALVFIGVIGASFRGADSDPEVFPTAAAGPPSQPGSPGPGGGAPPNGATTLQVTSRDLTFSPRSLSAPANTSVTVRMNNQDAGVLHNLSVYNNAQAQNRIFVGDLHTGPGNKDYTFTAPAPGNYFFRCDVHPDTMTGTFTSR